MTMETGWPLPAAVRDYLAAKAGTDADWVARCFAAKGVLVTGGTAGIGAAIVRRLRNAGAAVFVTARNRPADLERPELFLAADVADAAGTTALAEAALARLGAVDIFIHNVGGTS